jgi:hypothetical protein
MIESLINRKRAKNVCYGLQTTVGNQCGVQYSVAETGDN